MALANTLGAIATVANLPEGPTTTTIESKTNFFAAIPVGDTRGPMHAPAPWPAPHHGCGDPGSRVTGRVAALIQTQLGRPGTR